MPAEVCDTPSPSERSVSSETRASSGRAWLAPTIVFAVALAIRLAIIIRFPGNWHFDGYQRWAARDHLVVQVWLPATQAIVWGVTRLGGNLMALRCVLALLAALVVGFAALIAGRVGGTRAAWFTLPLAVYGPFVTWSVVPYQESSFLVVLLGALLLWKRWPLLADLVIGLIALVRYEGWPLLVVWVLMRRDPRALACLWGAALWLGLKAVGLVVPYAASPDSFADWQGLTERWTLKRHLVLLWEAYTQASESGMPWLVLLSFLGLRRPWARETIFLVIAVLGQFLALAGWVAALDTASSRMVVIPGIFLGIIGAVGLARLWQRFPRWRVVMVVGTLGLGVWTGYDGFRDSREEVQAVRKELKLAPKMLACDRDVWAMVPRIHPGPRRRHDGCEVIQGVTSWRVGQDFECTPWGWGHLTPTLRAAWSADDNQYLIERLSGASYDGCDW